MTVYIRKNPFLSPNPISHSGFGKKAFFPNPCFSLRFYFRRKSAGVFAE